jgi:TRAP-type C4-dicarboxylate transport system substrate-binding protein
MINKQSPAMQYRTWLIALCLQMIMGGAVGQATTDKGVAQAAPATQRVRVVGGLARMHQYSQHEEPFWTRELPRLSGGRYGGDIVPIDSAGVSGSDALDLIKLGVIGLGTIMLASGTPDEPLLGAPDLAGLNADLAAQRRAVQAYRPTLERALRDGHGIELLAVYTYPAQMLFCNAPVVRLEDLRGRRVRTLGVAQSDLVQALGGIPVTLPFDQVFANLRNGNVHCVITAGMSAHAIGLYGVTTHLYPLPLGWGISVFVAQRAVWEALPADLRSLLRTELPRLEQRIWDAAERDSVEGIACNAGRQPCSSGTRGAMTVPPVHPGDAQRLREALRGVVLPRWVQRCGAACARAWNATLAPSAGIEAAVPR